VNKFDRKKRVYAVSIYFIYRKVDRYAKTRMLIDMKEKYEGEKSAINN